MSKQLTWRAVFSEKRLLIPFIIGWILVLGFAYFAPIFLALIQARNGMLLHDFILEKIPPRNVSTLIFLLNYIVIVWMIIRSIKNPNLHFLFVVAFCLFYTIRFSTIYLVPLEPPIGIINLTDPFASKIIYNGGFINKDLFFSGHVGFLALIYFLLPTQKEKYIGLATTLLMTVLILMQHVHYTIDVVAAPFFAFLSYYLAKKTVHYIFPNWSK